MVLLNLTSLVWLLTAASSLAAGSSTSTTEIRRPSVKRDYSSQSYFVLELSSADQTPDEAASSLGLSVLEPVGELEGHYLVSATGSQRHDDTVAHYERLRRKRDASLDSVVSLEPQHPRQRVKRVFTPEIHDPSFFQLDRRQEMPVSDYVADIEARFSIADPIFPEQWHLVNDRLRQNSINVTGVWDQGYTGKGVNVAIVDDGLDMDSDDLAPNFFADGSWDFNDHTPLPKPRLIDDLHGTRCAGEVAAARNDACGVGIAYDAGIAGIRILSASITDADEAAALNYGYQHNDIYSCSWGPPDDGRSCEAPSRLISKAMLNGIQKGRGGKGSVFVFASGNGGAMDDQCNFDGYTNSIYSVTVGAIDREGLHPYYSEACSAVMVITYSSGSGDNIHTTDVGKQTCTSKHGGTSAAAPIAAGILALVLEVRPDLTWRDVQHLCVNSAVVVNPKDPDWDTTWAGRPYNHKYGYGNLDTWSIIEAAKTWELVRPQAWLETDVHWVPNDQQTMTADGVVGQIEITAEDLEHNNFERLEHITVRVDVEHQRRGNIEVQLISPNGIISSLARPRRFDSANSGLPGWTFMTVKHWGENPLGTWSVKVMDRQNNGKTGNFKGWSMTLWGESRDAELATPYKMPHDGALHLPPSPTDRVQNKPGASKVPEDENPDYNYEIFPSPEPKPDLTHGDGKGPQWTTATTNRKKPVKPTAHLPDDHDVAPGHSTLALDPAVNNKAQPTEAAAANSPTATSASYFGSLSSIVYNNTWFFAAGGGALLLGGSLLGYFLWRRMRNRRGTGDRAYEFEPLRGEEGGEMMPMGEHHASMNGGPGEERRTRDLYDAFGVDSEDEGSQRNSTTADRYQDHDEKPHSGSPKRSSSGEVLFSNEDGRS